MSESVDAGGWLLGYPWSEEAGSRRQGSRERERPGSSRAYTQWRILETLLHLYLEMVILGLVLLLMLSWRNFLLIMLFLMVGYVILTPELNEASIEGCAFLALVLQDILKNGADVQEWRRWVSQNREAIRGGAEIGICACILGGVWVLFSSLFEKAGIEEEEEEGKGGGAKQAGALADDRIEGRGQRGQEGTQVETTEMVHTQEGQEGKLEGKASPEKAPGKASPPKPPPPPPVAISNSSPEERIPWWFSLLLLGMPLVGLGTDLGISLLDRVASHLSSVPAQARLTVEGLSWLFRGLNPGASPDERLLYLQVLEESGTVCVGGIVLVLMGANLTKPQRRMMIAVGGMAVGLATLRSPELQDSALNGGKGVWAVLLQMSANGMNASKWGYWVKQNKGAIHRSAEGGAFLCFLAGIWLCLGPLFGGEEDRNTPPRTRLGLKQASPLDLKDQVTNLKGAAAPLECRGGSGRPQEGGLPTGRTANPEANQAGPAGRAAVPPGARYEI